LTERNYASQDVLVIDEIAPESRGTFLLSCFPGSLICTDSVAAISLWCGANKFHLSLGDTSGDAASTLNTIT
jgi:hypothetical protein